MDDCKVFLSLLKLARVVCNAERGCSESAVTLTFSLFTSRGPSEGQSVGSMDEIIAIFLLHNHPWLPLPQDCTGSSHPGFPGPILPPCHTVPATRAPLCSLDTSSHVGFPRKCSPALLVWRTPIHTRRPDSHVTPSWCLPTLPNRVCGSLSCALSGLDSPTRYTVYVPFPSADLAPWRSERWRALLGAPSSRQAVTRALTLPGLGDTHRAGDRGRGCPPSAEQASWVEAGWRPALWGTGWVWPGQGRSGRRNSL